jgi:hypothetical protein
MGCAGSEQTRSNSSSWTLGLFRGLRRLGYRRQANRGRVSHPVCYHGVQHLVSCGVRLPDQKVAGVEDGAAGELDADRLPDQVQLVHDVKDPLPGGGVLDN